MITPAMRLHEDRTPDDAAGAGRPHHIGAAGVLSSRGARPARRNARPRPSLGRLQVGRLVRSALERDAVDYWRHEQR